MSEIKINEIRNSTRKLVILAVMCALAVAGRAAFAWLPNFSPLVGIVMITGLALGSPAGFLAGIFSALASNFLFGHGVWTLFQMLSFGLCGFVFGLLKTLKIIPKDTLSAFQLIAVSIAGAMFVILVAGPILDLSTLFFLFSRISLESIIAILAAGFPFNCIHAASTFITLLLLTNPILWTVKRTCTKYGID